MRRFTGWLRAAGLLALLGLCGCGGSGYAPRDGDTVKPTLSPAPKWTAGKAGQIGVRLTAQGKDEEKARPLDFFHKADPVVKVTFFAGTSPLGTEEVTLDHRC
jgi:hypothetical protein